MSDANGILWRVNSTSGSASIIGSMGVPMGDIAMSPSGTLYGIGSGALWLIDPGTAAIARIGSLGVNGANGLVFHSSGQLFLSTLASTTTGEFRSVNPLTGATTLIGQVGFASAGDLAFAPDGKLYMSDMNSLLIEIDPRTGQGHAIGGMGFPSVFGLAFLSNTLYGVSNSGDLFTVDLLTGHGTLVARTSPIVFAYGAASSPVPEPASLVLFSTGLTAAAFAIRRRKRARPSA